ncbi:hypothetical protein EAE96_001037 [Botrytis aclada]|nr:hypothetical protein EAE96_001037 [Botrytis aclada]
MVKIMEELGWAGSVCLGLTCSQMYQIYKRLYPLKISLQEYVEAAPPYSFPVSKTPKPAGFQLFQLLETWHGDQYTYWEPVSSWGRVPGSNVDIRIVPARFLRKSIYDTTALYKTRFIAPDSMILRCSLERNYEDYFWFRTPRINPETNINDAFGSMDSTEAWPPGWVSQEENPESAFRMRNPLPNPYNMGVENWEKEAKKVILSTMDMAHNRRHWSWYWKECFLFRENFDFFQECWAEHQGEINSSVFSEWLLMIES